MLRCRRADDWFGSFPYLVLWEHFVHFLPSHVSNAPQPSQISIAALILTIISGRDRCRHFISCSPRSASLSPFLAPSFSLSLFLSLAVFTLWFLLCVTHQNAHKTLPNLVTHKHTGTHTHSNQLLYPGQPGVMNAWLIRQYFTVIHQVAEGYFARCQTHCSPCSPLFFFSLSFSHTHTHTNTHACASMKLYGYTL